MYGNLKHAVVETESTWDPESFELETEIESVLNWELILLLSAEFFVLALILTPLLPSTAINESIEAFWAEHRLVSLATFGIFFLITIPVSAGYRWFIRGWPYNLLIWALVVVSVAATVHISSVFADPRGIFTGCLAIGSILLILAIACRFAWFDFTGSAPWIVAISFMTVCFLPICLGGLLGFPSVFAAPTAALGAAVFILAEFRLMERGMTVGLGTRHDDPFTMSIWVNCSIWRFLVQVILLVLKLLLHTSVWSLQLLWRCFKWSIASMFSLVPRRWWTPAQTVDRLSHVT